jgi:hypothetical protein
VADADATGEPDDGKVRAEPPAPLGAARPRKAVGKSRKAAKKAPR